jgi:hypothetical protein
MRVVKKEAFHWNHEEELYFNETLHFLHTLYEQSEADGELETICGEARDALYQVYDFCEGVEN